MGNLLHNDEFETFLQKQVKDHRMYPADQIWRNIQKEIHGEGRWPALTYISIFIITALSICTLMVKPEERLHKNTIVYLSQKEETGFIKTAQNAKDDAVASAPVQYAYTDKITQQTMQSVSDIIIARKEEQHSVEQHALTKESLLTIQDKPAQNINNSLDAITVKTTVKQAVLQAAVAATAPNITTAENITQLAIDKPASRYFSTLGLLNPADFKKPSDDPSSFYNDDDMWRTYPLLSTEYIIRKKLSKLSFQFYVTPSISYRRLTDADGKNTMSYAAIPRDNNYQLDIHHVVEHRPAMGAEAGFALGYKLTDALSLTGGLQFNIRQYGIKAYMLSIPTPSSDGTSGNIVTGMPDEQTATSNSYFTSTGNSFGGSQPVILNNRYYEISAPIGINWRIITSGNGRLSLNAAASLQPTYTLDKDPFVLTTDYKSYTDGLSVMRNWNLNSSAEAFISYKIGPFRWQLGPQFRYQHFSTYSNSYPIREHLLDYGIKFGFTKSLD